MADTVRIASFHTELSARGPGLALRDVTEDAPEARQVLGMIARARPDIVMLQGIDYDAGGALLRAMQDRLEAAGHPMPHAFAAAPNSGLPSGIDLDGDGRLGQPRDAQGYGRFFGAGGLAILSRHPVERDGVRDLSTLLWSDLPGSLAPETDLSPEARAIQRLSSTAHWVVPVRVGDTRLNIVTWAATPPLFQPSNAARNHDETAVILRLLDGELPVPAPDPPFAIAGLANADPDRGAGRPDALRALLGDPRVTDPLPQREGDRATASFGDTALRLSYVLPSRDLGVVASGLLDPADIAAIDGIERGTRHRLVWVEVALPGGPS
ncbi:endonuclease/exonuclease/phosphatase family protein [Palleronia sediminis]|uniref:endonuclease/exonuclease/phosphatase family protein n=1 Tax=Palleronia sediminis TaxID=2547833 RepID=UPI001454FC10|nr:endonuclease/exonuclease/phosphatase family protein [Palleronia sediminis]